MYDVILSTSGLGEAISLFLQHFSVLIFCIGKEGESHSIFISISFGVWVDPPSRLALGSVL
jgi:hypothetical protein